MNLLNLSNKRTVLKTYKLYVSSMQYEVDKLQIIWYNNLTKHNPNTRFGVFRRTLNHTASAQRACTTWYNNLTKHNPNTRFGVF